MLDMNTWNHLALSKQLNSYQSSKNTVTYKLLVYKLYIYGEKFLKSNPKGRIWYERKWRHNLSVLINYHQDLKKMLSSVVRSTMDILWT